MTLPIVTPDPNVIPPVTPPVVPDPNAVVPPVLDPSATPIDPNAVALPDPNEVVPPVPDPQIEALNKRLDVFDKTFGMLERMMPAQQPAAPQGPVVADEIKTIDQGIADLDKQIDKATEDSKPISGLLGARDTLNSKKLRLQIRSEDIEPAFQSGMQTLDALTDTVTAKDMPYLAIPEVKDRYEALVGNLAQSERMNPAVRKSLYSMAVGDNTDKIFEQKQEEALRQQTLDTQVPPNTTPGRVPEIDPNVVPDPATILSPLALDAIRVKGQTVDQYYVSLDPVAYAGGFKDWWEKTGKEYHTDGEGAKS